MRRTREVHVVRMDEQGPTLVSVVKRVPALSDPLVHRSVISPFRLAADREQLNSRGRARYVGGKGSEEEMDSENRVFGRRSGSASSPSRSRTSASASRSRVTSRHVTSDANSERLERNSELGAVIRGASAPVVLERAAHLLTSPHTWTALALFSSIEAFRKHHPRSTEERRD